jgi:hypothetical protein
VDGLLLVEHCRRGPILDSVLKRLGRGAVDARMLRDEGYLETRDSTGDCPEIRPVLVRRRGAVSMGIRGYILLIVS